MPRSCRRYQGPVKLLGRINYGCKMVFDSTSYDISITKRMTKHQLQTCIGLFLNLIWYPSPPDVKNSTGGDGCYTGLGTSMAETRLTRDLVILVLQVSVCMGTFERTYCKAGITLYFPTLSCTKLASQPMSTVNCFSVISSTQLQ